MRGMTSERASPGHTGKATDFKLELAADLGIAVVLQRVG